MASDPWLYMYKINSYYGCDVLTDYIRKIKRSLLQAVSFTYLNNLCVCEMGGGGGGNSV